MYKISESENLKVLVLTVTTGEGHNAFARSISNALEQSGVATKIIQLYGYSEKNVKKANKTYLRAVKYIPKLYNLIWLNQRKIKPEKRYKNMLQPSIKKSHDYLLKEINEFKPDAIYSTTNYGSAALCNLRRKGLLPKNIIIYGMVTDFCLCPYWESAILVDKVFIAIEPLQEQLIERGFTADQVACCGFPVHEKFKKEITKEQACKDLEIPNKFTAVVMSGGNGAGNILKLIKELKKVKHDFQIICVNGRNEVQKKKIDNYIINNKITNIYNYGFATNMEVIMSAADCLFTPGGASTITECLAKNLCIIFREKTIINEKINKEIFVELGAALGLDKLSDAHKKVNFLIENPDELLKIKKNIEKYNKPNAAADIVNYILNYQK